jgi:hypothetical protein
MLGRIVSQALGSSFDYIIIYSMDADAELSGLPLDDNDLERYQEEDEKGKRSSRHNCRCFRAMISAFLAPLNDSATIPTGSTEPPENGNRHQR